MKPNERTFITRILALLTRRQREQEFRLSVAETATENITMRLEYVEEENEMMRLALAELWPLVRTSREYATPGQLWAIAVSRDMARLEKRDE